MFEALAERYYTEEEVSEDLRVRLRACWQRAESAIGQERMEFIRANAWFHDWYVLEFRLRATRKLPSCQIALYHNEAICKIQFFGIESICCHGALAATGFLYPPGKRRRPSFAQVLELWLDNQRCLECCLLLDNERFIVIKAKEMAFES